MRASKRIHAAIEQLERRWLLAAQLIADLQGGTNSSGPGEYVTAGNFVYFTADDGVGNQALYRTTGTPGGAELIKSVPIIPGANSWSPHDLMAVGDRIYFVASDDAHGEELWTSDGTTAGTKVFDVTPGPDGSYPGSLTDVNGTLWFVPRFGDSIWTSDGTEAGTQPLVSLGSFLNQSYYRYEFVPRGSEVDFIISTVADGYALWKTDGTQAGTSMVYDARTGSDFYGMRNLVNVNGRLFYAAEDDTHGQELWTSDGTTAGTHMVADLQTGTVNSFPTNLTNFNGTLYFTAYQDAFGTSLYRANSDGSGVQLITQTQGRLPGELTVSGGLLYFSTSDQTFGNRLWTSDGVTTSPVTSQPFAGEVNQLVAVGNKIFFTSSPTSNYNDRELYISDGTEAGTHIIKEINPGPDGSVAGNGAALGSELIFPADDGIHGVEPWVSDGSAPGTSLILDINLTGAGSFPGNIHATQSRLYFTAGTSLAGAQFYTMNKTSGALQPIMGVTLDGGAIALGDKLVFAGDGAGGNEPWITDGTPGGTMQLADIYPGEDYSYPSEFVVFNNNVYFVARSPFTGFEVWKTDGTPAGTIKLKETGANSASFAGALTVSGGMLYFLTDDSLWASDGSEAGTHIAAALPQHEPFGLPTEIVDAGGTLYLAISSTSIGRELWKYTPSGGLALVKDIDPGGSAGVSHLVADDNRVFFDTDGEAVGHNLWISDGTPDGTQAIHPVGGFSPSYQGGLVVSAGRVYFTVVDEDHGDELWSSDGTAAGTSIVADIVPGPDGSHPDNLVASGGLVYFRASTPTEGRELWVTDGTPGGTHIVQDLAPGTADSNPEDLYDDHGVLYFSAAEPVHGQELYKLADTTAPRVIGSSFDLDAAQQQINVRFSENVAASLAAPGLELTNRDTNATVPSSLAYDETTNRVFFRFPGFTGGILRDGNYRAILHSGDVRDVSLNVMASDLVLDFFSLTGDANHDRHVNTLDFDQLAVNFNQSGISFSQGDFNYDGNVNALDFNALAMKFGTFLAPPAGPAATISANDSTPARLMGFASPSLFAQERIRHDESVIAADVL